MDTIQIKDMLRGNASTATVPGAPTKQTPLRLEVFKIDNNPVARRLFTDEHMAEINRCESFYGPSPTPAS